MKVTFKLKHPDSVILIGDGEVRYMFNTQGSSITFDKIRNIKYVGTGNLILETEDGGDTDVVAFNTKIKIEL